MKSIVCKREREAAAERWSRYWRAVRSGANALILSQHNAAWEQAIRRVRLCREDATISRKAGGA